MENFQSLGLPPALMNALQQMNFSTPTPIQAQAIPLALEGKDVLGSAQTGTGKTGAFGIPARCEITRKPARLCNGSHPDPRTRGTGVRSDH